ncbi:hypothetical protein PHIN3_342 [Sinorhizobium phage phiN3]|uniref:Uncharacterized protein n=1 Tax=Sinorhizobium phage phiN3 TaxID=1647405 RepID=A0A0F6WD31_9CAUD|nr:hypothetical protein AVT40_gp191 [Sinorhizobium phage phiN3]AKF13605.1 hypothetical protein PHIN3_342 [Sinorhizobium phage phiN3]
MYSKEQLSEVMKAAWAFYRARREGYGVRQIAARPAEFSFATALKTAWRKFKTAAANQARFDALPEDQKKVVAALIQAYEDAVYLPAHMSMSRRREEISQKINQMCGFYLDEFRPKM